MADLIGKKPSEFSDVTAKAINQRVKEILPFKTYVAEFYCNGSDTLTVTPLNSLDSDYLGDIVWSGDFMAGELYGDLVGAFNAKTFIICYPIMLTGQQLIFVNVNSDRIMSFINETYTSILEIRVYKI